MAQKVTSTDIKLALKECYRAEIRHKVSKGFRGGRKEVKKPPECRERATGVEKR